MRRGGPDEHVAHAGLAYVSAPVVAGEALHQHRGELDFAVHEDVLAGHEHVVDDDHRLLAGELRVAGVEVPPSSAARVAGLPPVDVGEPRSSTGMAPMIA